MIGASWGGIEALQSVLGPLKTSPDAAILIVLHRAPVKSALDKVLSYKAPVEVQEVEDGMIIENGHIYLAPADLHVTINPGTFQLNSSAQRSFARPSIDIAFESAAKSYGEELAGIIMTGELADGAQGLREIASRGGVAIIQDPSEAEKSSMPREALQLVPTAQVMKKEEITTWLRSYL